MAIDTYLNNITSEHRDKPKFISWLTASLSKTDDAYNCIKSIDLAFDLDNAIGVQQDILGVIIGRKRRLRFQPKDGSSPVMDDLTYRAALRAKILQNMWDGTLQSIYDLWNTIFPNTTTSLKLQVIDNQDMTITVLIRGIIDKSSQQLISNGYLIPKPAGVALTVMGFSDSDFKASSGILISTCDSCEVIELGYENISFNNITYGAKATVHDSIIVNQKPLGASRSKFKPCHGVVMKTDDLITINQSKS